MPIVISANNIKEFDNIVNTRHALIRYHSPNCGHCVAMESEWKALDHEKSLKAKNIAIVDIDVSIADMINHPSAKTALVQGVPSIYFIKKNQLFEYTGERKAKNIAEFAIAHVDNSKPDNISDTHPASIDPQKMAKQKDIAGFGQQFREYIVNNSINKPRRRTNRHRRNVRRSIRRPHKSNRGSSRRPKSLKRKAAGKRFNYN